MSERVCVYYSVCVHDWVDVVKFGQLQSGCVFVFGCQAMQLRKERALHSKRVCGQVLFCVGELGFCCFGSRDANGMARVA